MAGAFAALDAETEVHLLAIRKALANGNAAVMVGSGFSRNADGGENLATWSQLSEALSAELSPGREPGTFSPAGTSQLAEQYSRVFSPSHLEQLIKRCVPDDQVTPGPLHAALLKLPWAEVFTTNYDTLLERAADKLFEVSYFTVCSREDIPQSKVLNRRRIVKLHGSFPSHRPFILTEEHYRTYPEKFAPFVNLVRQSLLENVFCLIGFSGDDPNFLHWLGWVRDMLDKHSLPVYLFLTAEPTLGESKLYEARGVLPVILPIGGCGDRDYQARYSQLFKELKKPLSDSPLDWGDCPHSSEIKHGESKDEDFTWFLNQLPALIEYRRSYPGWLIAPSKNRNKFRSVADWLQSHLHQEWTRQSLITLSPPLTLTVIELYCWVQQVMLCPLDDSLAVIGHDAVLAINVHALDDLAKEMPERLKQMGVTDANSLQKIWIQTAIALLAWARQSHRVAHYNELRQRLQPLTAVQDRLVYEEVLRCLQNADRRTAFEMVTKWRPKSSDAYVQVLKASLLAEAGDPSSAILLCEQAIQVLRRQQRSRPDDPPLISKEAWACLVASLIQRAVEFSGLLQGTSQLGSQDDEPEHLERENFNDRINVLGARGYSAREELNTAAAKLNAEAELPTAEQQRTTNFELGSTSVTTRHGCTSDLREKISASFAWLELIERVGLMPHMQGGNFYTQEMLQAAWWARFADRPERSTGLLLRANQHDSLKPRDIALPPHRTGWLSRYEVAIISEETATDLAGELIRLTTTEFDGRRPAPGASRRIAFVIEVFGRLVIRVRDDSLLSQWGQQLLSLHRAVAFQSDPSAWKPACQALARVLESMPSAAQSRLLFLAFQLPLVPSIVVNDHQLEGWANLGELTKSSSLEDGQGESLDWRSVVQELLFKLRVPRSNEPSWLVWRRLEVLRVAGLLTADEKQEVGNLLWVAAEPGQWPVIPGADPASTLNWPSQAGGMASLFLDKLLDNQFRPFGSGYMQLTPAHKQRSYHIGGEGHTLSQLWFALRLNKPSLGQISKLISVIDEWVDAEQGDLLGDISVHHELRNSVALIIDYLDELLALCVQQLSQKKKGIKAAKLRSRILALDARLQLFPFERMKLHLALINSGDRQATELDALLRGIIHTLSSNSAKTSGQAARAARALLRDAGEQLRESIQSIFDATVACVYTRRMPSLLTALDILISLQQESWRRWLDSRSLLFLDVALGDLAIQLAYDSAVRDQSIPDESVPLLRFKAIQLAFALIEVAGVESEVARRWLTAAPGDPLPELRLGRFKVAK
ncbi:SIR2 family NAD-dependent protein deacylase [Pseudomonas aeruginosa]|nr:SIR2 family protein [Pseudomonas aeruginosa]MCS9845744.1 SIR2 family protein [Pseudomonas aeruginosa]MCT0571852.1 SIR2 family protein [Pseudomonas aeruginosa]HEJ3814030.1 SIR2 family protein [Pseudomonas aeruginosa]